MKTLLSVDFVAIEIRYARITFSLDIIYSLRHYLIYDDVEICFDGYGCYGILEYFILH